jgi:hypothetical protein
MKQPPFITPDIVKDLRSKLSLVAKQSVAVIRL